MLLKEEDAQWPQTRWHMPDGACLVLSLTLHFFFLLLIIFIFSFLLYIYLNWRLIMLQYCSGFCHTSTWISHGCTCDPILNPLTPPSPSHPSRLLQCSGFECPASCIKLGLVIYFTYDNIHVSMLFSQIIPPSPSSKESKRLFFISVSFLLSRI